MQQNYIKILGVTAFMVLCLMMQNCAGISMAEYQDAETLGKRNLGFTMGTTGAVYYAYGLKKLETGKNEKFFIPEITEIRGQYGLSNRIDIGISAWSGFLLYNAGHYLFTGENSTWGYDYGYKGLLKYTLTSDEDIHQWAFIVYGLGYKIRDNHGFTDGYLHFDASGFAPAVIYGYNFDNRNQGAVTENLHVRSLYGGLKINTLYYHYHEVENGTTIKKSNLKDVFPNLFFGINFKDKTGFTVLEAAYTNMKDPIINKRRQSVAFSAGKTFIFHI